MTFERLKDCMLIIKTKNLIDHSNNSVALFFFFFLGFALHAVLPRSIAWVKVAKGGFYVDWSQWKDLNEIYIRPLRQKTISFYVCRCYQNPQPHSGTEIHSLVQVVISCHIWAKKKLFSVLKWEMKYLFSHSYTWLKK